MSNKDPKLAQRVRAEQLRKQIADLKSDESGPSEANTLKPEPESPRNFIHRKMHELDQAKKGKRKPVREE